MTEEKTPLATILVVDDTPMNLRLLAKILTRKNYRVRLAPDGLLALESIKAEIPDIVLLDINMPKMDGYEVCESLKANDATAHIPVIFISALGEVMDKVRAFNVGGVDYITKPFQVEEVLARVATHLTMRDLQKKLQSTNMLLEERIQQRTAELNKTNAILEQEVQERIRAEEALRAIVEGTAATTGGDFLRTLVQHLADALNMDAAMVTECISSNKDEVHTLAFWYQEKAQENFTYHTQNTPCEEVLAGNIRTHEHIERTNFVGTVFEPYSFQAYIGFPLYTASGEVLGHLAVFHTQPIEKNEHHLELLQIFAARTGAELERKKAEDELRYTNSAYSRFVPKEFLTLLAQENIIDVRLGDQVQMEMTVLFSDIRSFTSISEQMTPQENFTFLNAYLERVSPIIREHGGFIDKFLGDGIMALFPNADNALQAGIAMQHEVKIFNKLHRSKNQEDVNIGIGIHTGSLMLGIIGEEERLQGTVIADAVNTASRIDGLTKVYGAPLLISEETLSRLADPQRYRYRFLDRVQMKGKRHPVGIFEVFDGESDDIAKLKLSSTPLFADGLTLYQNRMFAEASVKFSEVLRMYPDDRAARLYLGRAAYQIVQGSENDFGRFESLLDE